MVEKACLRAVSYSDQGRKGSLCDLALSVSIQILVRCFQAAGCDGPFLFLSNCSRIALLFFLFQLLMVLFEEIPQDEISVIIEY